MNATEQASLQAKELKGRLHLWNTALLEVRILLADARRAREARDLQPFPVGEITEASRSGHPFGTWIDLDQVVTDFLDDADVDVIKRAEGRALYCWGVVSYLDMFDVERETKFCHYIYWHPDGSIAGYYEPRYSDAT